jgi:tetratricopeptide (TPR) repeat protein
MERAELQKELERAIESGKKRDYARSVELLLPIYYRWEELPEIALFLGRSYHALGNHDLAISCLRDYHTFNPESVSGMFFLGRAYFASGRPREALFQLKRALDRSPGSVQIETYLAYAYYRAGRHDIALGHFSCLLERKKGGAKLFQAYLNCLYIQAIKTFHRGDIEEAFEQFLFLKKEGVESVLLFLYLGMIYREYGEPEDALEAYDKAQELAPEDDIIRYRRISLLLELGDPEIANVERSKMKESSLSSTLPEEKQPDPVDEEYQIALAYYNEGNFRKAAYHALRVLKLGGQGVDIRLMIGESFRKAGDFEKAENHFRRALDLDRSRIEARYGIAMVQWQTEKYEELLHTLLGIERSDPGNEIGRYYQVLAQWKLGSLDKKAVSIAKEVLEKSEEGGDYYLMTAIGTFYLKQGETDSGVMWLRKALEQDRKEIEALELIIELYEKLYNDGNEKILEPLSRDYRAYLDLVGEDRAVLKKLVISEYYLGHLKSCLQYGEMFLRCDSGDMQIKRLMAICYRKTDEWSKAALLYRELLRQKPENERFVVSMTYCLEKGGRKEEAIRFLEAAIDGLQQPSYSLYLVLGTILYHTKSYKKAEKIFRKSIEISPSSWQGYQNLGMVMKRMNRPEMGERYLSMAKERR